MKIASVKIERFRGIKKLDISRFDKITVIGGTNNCGKSSLLEAIFLNSCMTKPNVCSVINGKRRLGTRKISDLSSIFYGKDMKKSVFCGLTMDNKAEREVSVHAVQPDKVTYHETPEHFNASEISTALDGLPHLKQCFVWRKRGRKTISDCCYYTEEGEGRFSGFTKKVLDPWRCAYLTTKHDAATHLNLVYLIESGEKKSIVSALHDVDNRILDVDVIGDRAFATLFGIDKPLPIEVLGDGMMKIIKAIALMYRVKGGSLCIDEIENGLHYTSMTKFWESLIVCAKKWNVQLIVTTHNLEMLQSLSAKLEVCKGCGFCYLKLERCSDDVIVSTALSANSFVEHLRQGVEIR